MRDAGFECVRAALGFLKGAGGQCQRSFERHAIVAHGGSVSPRARPWRRNAPLGGPRIRAVWAPGTSGAGHGLISAMKIISGPNRKNERGNSDSALKTLLALPCPRCGVRTAREAMRLADSSLRSSDPWPLATFHPADAHNARRSAFPRVTERLPDGRQRHTSID